MNDATKELTAELEKLLKSAFDDPIYSDHRSRFSPSSLPFCPREYVIFHRLNDETKAMQSWDYYGEFYTSQGHAIHEAIQKTLGRAGLLFGNWICCGLTYTFCKSAPCLICGEWPEYGEMQLDKKITKLNGFIDGILLEYNAVLEVKSKGERALGYMEEAIWYEWALQASCYAVGMNRMYGWNLDKIIMFYASRDNPRKWKIFVMPVIQKVLDSQYALVVQAEEELHAGTLPEGYCTKQQEGIDMGCIYASICFSPTIENMLIPVTQLVKGQR